MQDLFSNLSHAVEGAPVVAVLAAFLWGILSIVLSPCHLASLPLIVGFIHGQGRMTTRRATLLATLFSLGILVTIAVLGAVTAAAGRLLGDVGAVGNYVVAAIFFVIGLHLMDVIPLPLPGPASTGTKNRGAMAAFVLGLVFGIALGPCTFAYLAPMLAVTFQIAATRLAYGILLLLCYGLGHCAVIAVAGASSGLVQNYLDWTERSPGAAILKKVCGVLVLAGGVYLIYTVS